MPLALLTGPQDPSQLNATVNAVINNINANAGMANSARFTAPIAAELVSIKAAAVAAAGAITIAGQPDYPRKLQVRVVVTTPITVGTLTLVGTDVHGNTVTEVVSLVQPVTITIQTVNAYAHLTSGTVSTLTGGGDGTLGIGVSAQLGLPCAPGSPITGGVTSGTNTGQTGGLNGFSVFKENDDNADATVGTVDAVAGTVSPTAAPNATHNYTFWYRYNEQE